MKDCSKRVNIVKKRTKFIINGFKNGFELGYDGPTEVQQKSPNLKFTIGDETELWNKVMKEVKEKRYAGLYEEIPFKNFIQSPIGLVPKDGGKKTRLIFHLSYPRNVQPPKSVNANTPKEKSRVKYVDFNEAIELCLKAGRNCKIAKSDMSNAFRNLPIRKEDWKYLIMKAKSPIDEKYYYFIDKCLPFGASISCAVFQTFSNSVAHLVKTRSLRKAINYLDDFFFAAFQKLLCNRQIQHFIDICAEIRFPISQEKTFWATTNLTFLGLLINTVSQTVSLPMEKLEKTLQSIHYILNKKNKKITLLELQKICGLLNFVSRCVLPGRAFTRRLYAAGKGITKPNHHIYVNLEMKADLKMWQHFLQKEESACRPFLDFSITTAKQLDWYTDASKTIGCGGYFNKEWFAIKWTTQIKEQNFSIGFLELFAVTTAILNWGHKIKNLRVLIFCDNMSVVHMINTNTSSCKHCMKLIRIIVLKSMECNVRFTARHVLGKLNTYSDLLSRGRLDTFWKLAEKEQKEFNKKPTKMPAEIWPMEIQMQQ